MMLTTRDQYILGFINIFGGITTEQAAKMFFPTKYGYDVAKRRLKKMCEAGLIHDVVDLITRRKVYYTDRNPSAHSIILTDLYVELNYLGVECIKFDREVKLDNVRCDALLITKYKNVAKIFLVEVDITHQTKNEKYLKLYQSGILQKQYGTFPIVLIIEKQYYRQRKLCSVPYRVEREGYDMKNLIEIVGEK